MTHERFKVLCALADMTGLPEKTGLSAAQVVRAHMKEADEPRPARPSNVIRFPEDDPSQLTLPFYSAIQ